MNISEYFLVIGTFFKSGLAHVVDNHRFSNFGWEDTFVSIAWAFVGTKGVLALYVNIV